MENITIRQLRKRWMLSQAELAGLLGVDQASVSRYENGDAPLSLPVALALQVILGCPMRKLLPSAYALVEEAVMRRAVELERSIAGKSDYASAKKQQLLDGMMMRATKRPVA